MNNATVNICISFCVYMYFHSLWGIYLGRIVIAGVIETLCLTRRKFAKQLHKFALLPALHNLTKLAVVYVLIMAILVGGRLCLLVLFGISLVASGTGIVSCAH